MYELKESDSEFLGLNADQHQYINLLLKQAYQKGCVDTMDSVKSLITQ